MSIPVPGESYITQLERVLSIVSPISIDILMRQFGVNVEVYEPVIDKYSDLYGNYSASTEEVYDRKVSALFTGVHALMNISSSDMPLFEEAYCYLQRSDDLTIGSLIRIVREDLKDTWFLVEEIEAIGATLDIIRRYRLSAVER